MRKRILVVIPVVVAVAYLVVQALVPASARTQFFVAEIATVKLMATIGCLAAATRFRRREYLGVAWMLLGANYALLFVKDLLFGLHVHLPGLDAGTAAALRACCVIAANLAAAAGCIMLARVWRVAGIALPGSRASQRAAFAVATAFAVAIVGWGLWKELHGAVDGEAEAIIAVASNLGDVVAFSVIAPLLLTALAMRGGALAWPWALLTTSNVAWLLYDMTWSFETQLGLAQPTLRTVEELWRALGCALALSAGLAQRWAVRSAAHERVRAGVGLG